MLKKIFTMLLCGIFMFSTMGTALAEVPNTADDKLSAIETAVYGGPQTGALVDRINRLERDYEGKHPNGGMMDRINYLYDFTFDNSAAPSLITQMNALEWTISHQISNECMQKRVSDMENAINGKVSEGSFKTRIESLSSFAFGSVTIPLTQVTVPANTLVKVALVTPINAKNLKKGDVIKLQVAEDVIENNMLIFTKGGPGEAVVNKVSQAKNFGRNAEIGLDFKSLTAVDGRSIEMTLGEESKQSMEQMGMAAGASVAGMVVLGPIGIIGGAFVKGKNINLPEGTELFIQTKSDSTVYAIPTSGK